MNREAVGTHPAAAPYPPEVLRGACSSRQTLPTPPLEQIPNLDGRLLDSVHKCANLFPRALPRAHLWSVSPWGPQLRSLISSTSFVHCAGAQRALNPSLSSLWFLDRSSQTLTCIETREILTTALQVGTPKTPVRE